MTRHSAKVKQPAGEWAISEWVDARLLSTKTKITGGRPSTIWHDGVACRRKIRQPVSRRLQTKWNSTTVTAATPRIPDNSDRRYFHTDFGGAIFHLLAAPGVSLSNCWHKRARWARQEGIEPC